MKRRMGIALLLSAMCLIFSASTAGAVKFYGCQFNEPIFETLEETRLSGPEAIKDLPSNQGKVFVSHPVLDGYPEGTTFVYRSANMYGDRAAARMNTNLLVFAQKHFENKENAETYLRELGLIDIADHSIGSVVLVTPADGEAFGQADQTNYYKLQTAMLAQKAGGKDAEGNDVVRSFYDFVRDHLGYRLNLHPESTVKADGGNLAYDLTITNTGFATVINPKEVYLVLVSEENQVVKEFKLDVDPKNWIPTTEQEPDVAAKYSLKGSVAAGVSGKFKVGLWIPEKGTDAMKYNADYAIRLAQTGNVSYWTDATGKYSVNIIGEIVF